MAGLIIIGAARYYGQSAGGGGTVGVAVSADLGAGSVRQCLTTLCEIAIRICQYINKGARSIECLP